MQTEEKCIELRVAYPCSRVSAIGLGCLTGNFKKVENPFLNRYERLPDKREQHVHLLPDCDLTYEIEEVVDGKRVHWYAATLEGDPTIYRISLYGAKAYARREMTLRSVVAECPEMPNPADFKDEED
jgi:hypothetical protein